MPPFHEKHINDQVTGILSLVPFASVIWDKIEMWKPEDFSSKGQTDA
jgi:hypothetical protein